MLFGHVSNFGGTLKSTQLGSRVIFLHVVNRPFLAKVEVDYAMAGIHRADDSVYEQPSINVLVGVAGYVEIAWNFLHCKRSSYPAASLLLKGLLCYLVLPHYVWLVE